MYNTGYPTTTFQWTDTSGASTDTLFSAPVEGLGAPFVFLLAERGVPGEIYYGAAAELTKFLGSETFNQTSPYFNSATLFAGTAMGGQGVYAMRLVDPDAKKATFGLFLQVTSKNITQYQKNVDGSRKVDGDGDFVPRVQVDGTTAVTEPGLVLKWLVRKLADNEDFDALTVVTTTVSGNTVKTYPILAGDLFSQGKYGNRQGFSFYSSPARNSVAARAIGSTLYRFQPMALPTAISTVARPIPDVFGSQFNDVSFKKNAVYTGTGYNYGFNHILNTNYVDAESGDASLPYALHVYGEHIGTIGAAALALSPELSDLDAYELDLVLGTDAEGHLFDHIEIDEESASVVGSAVTNYASGGTDGVVSWAKLEELVKEWLEGTDHGEFGNVMQHPMTHYTDPGFSMQVKPLLLKMLALRDGIGVDLSTQDVALRPNTKAEDIAAGQALLFAAQMYPESTINGVGCARVGIYAHAGRLATAGGYEGLVPYTYNRLLQRRNLDGGRFVKGSSGGLPNSAVSVFRKANWVADDENSQALAWASCINTVRHASRTTVFYPSLRTVYPNDTSLLSDSEVVDRILYMKKIVREVWALFVGVRQPKKDLFPRIQNEINQRCAAAFPTDDININATVGQTAQDANLGSQLTVTLAVTGSSPLRTMNFDVIVGRAVE